MHADAVSHVQKYICISNASYVNWFLALLRCFQKFKDRDSKSFNLCLEKIAKTIHYRMMTDFESARVRDYSKEIGQPRRIIRILIRIIIIYPVKAGQSNDLVWALVTFVKEYKNAVVKILLRQKLIQTFLRFGRSGYGLSVSVQKFDKEHLFEKMPRTRFLCSGGRSRCHCSNQLYLYQQGKLCVIHVRFLIVMYGLSFLMTLNQSLNECPMCKGYLILLNQSVIICFIIIQSS